MYTAVWYDVYAISCEADLTVVHRARRSGGMRENQTQQDDDAATETIGHRKREYDETPADYSFLAGRGRIIYTLYGDNARDVSRLG